MNTSRYFCLFCLALFSFGFAQNIDFYVSTLGNDAWSGKLADPMENDGPFATIFRAQQAVRDLKEDSALTAPVTVYIRGGLYELDKKISFLPQDSGTKTTPITYANYQNEKVVFSGGRTITGWRHIRDNRWVCDIPEAKSGWTFQALFVNGQRRYRAHSPNEGYYRVKDPMEDPSWPFHHYRYQFGFYPGHILSNWRNLQDVEIVMLHFWSDARSPIESVDAKTLTVRLSTPIWRRFTDDHTPQGARYFIDNVYEGLDAPGEWYLDRAAGKLYYLAMPDEDVKNAEIVAPYFDQLLLLLGNPMRQEYVEHVTISGLNFVYTDWQLPPGDSGDHFAADMVPAAVEATAARHVNISNCTFEHIGTYGIGIYDGCRDITIQKNTLRDLAAGGIQIGGGSASEDELLKTSHITITDNTLTDLGRIFYSGIGILSMHASESVIAHNHISDLYYCGISIGKEWGYRPSAAYKNRIEYNVIDNAGQGLLSDMGGIYMLGISPGTVVRNNLVHKIYTHGYGGWGIYTDEGSSGILIEKNIVYDTKSAGLHQHYGRDNVIRNNIFAFGREAQLMRSRNEAHLSFDFKRNIVYWRDSHLLANDWKGDTSNFDFQNNLYYRADGRPIQFLNKSILDWQKTGQDTASVFANPKFIDPDNGDFNLAADSPAFGIGFEPIDMTVIGPRLWPEEVVGIEYTSHADSSRQTALFYNSGSARAKPLLVVLPARENNIRQEAGVQFAKWCLLKDWIFLQPGLDGLYNQPAVAGACAAPANVLSAVDFAKQHANVDTTRIYLAGLAGGGYMALSMAAAAPDIWAAISVWAPFADSTVWRHEKAAENPSAEKIGGLDGEAANQPEGAPAERHQLLPAQFSQKAANVPLDINAGIYGAQAGGSPSGHLAKCAACHSLQTFNAIAAPVDQVNEQTVDFFMRQMASPDSLQNAVNDPYYADQTVLFRRASNKTRVTIFDGGDEIIPDAALHWLENQVRR